MRALAAGWALSKQAMPSGASHSASAPAVGGAERHSRTVEPAQPLERGLAILARWMIAFQPSSSPSISPGNGSRAIEVSDASAARSGSAPSSTSPLASSHEAHRASA